MIGMNQKFSKFTKACLTSILLVINVLILSGQKQLVYTFYSNNNSLVKEKYYTLNSDTSVKDSLYYAFSQDGHLLKRGFYSNGEKLGEWFRFLPNRQIESYGYYNVNNQFSGCRLYYHPNGDIDQIDFYIEDIAYNDSPEIQQEFISSIADDLRMAGFFSFDPLSNKATNLQKSLDLYERINNRTKKLLFGNRIISDAYFYKGWFQEFKDERNQLNQLETNLEKVKGKFDPSFEVTYFKPISESLDSLLKSDSIQYVLDRGPVLRQQFQSLTSLQEDIEPIQEKIKKGRRELESNFKEVLPKYYQSEIERFDAKYSTYTLESDLQSKLTIGKELIEMIDLMNVQFGALIEMQNTINEEKERLNPYKDKYPTVYLVEEEAINQKINTYDRSTSYQEKLELGKEVFDYIEKTILNLNAVDSMEVAITKRYQPLRNNYLKSYIRIHAKEIKPIASAIAGFNRLSILERKKQVGQDILDTIVYYQQTYNRLQQIDSVLDQRYSRVKNNFKENFRKIYKSEIAPLDSEIKRYRDNRLSKSKLDAGNLILEKISSLENNFKKIQAQRKKIDSRYPAISAKYEKDFPPIFKKTLKLQEGKMEIYESSETCKLYLERGEVFLKETELLEQQYAEIMQQNSDISKNLNVVENLFKIKFPEITDTEIKDIKDQFKDYISEGYIGPKIQAGDLILSKLNLMQASFTKLDENQSKIDSEFNTLVKNYKEHYSVLYKAHIKTLMDDEKLYKQTGYHMSKLTYGDVVVEKIDEYSSKFEIFRRQDSEMSTKYTEFESKYANRKEVKFMYRKGRWAYNELLKSYEKETDFEKKEQTGDLISLMLVQLISFASKDTTLINSELKKAKTVDDVLRILNVGQIEK
jgi:hypothetical protein